MKTIEVNKKLNDKLRLVEVQGYEEHVGDFKQFQFFEFLIDAEGYEDYYILRANRDQLILFINYDRLEIIQFPFSEGSISDEMYEFELFKGVFNIVYQNKKFFAIIKTIEAYDIMEEAICELIQKYESQGFDL